MSNGAAAAAAFMPSGDVGNKAKSFVLIAVILIVIVIIIVAIKQGSKIFGMITGGIDSFLEKIGLKDDAEDKKATADVAAIDGKASSQDSPFNPTFYKHATPGTALFTQARANELANQVYDSVGAFYDDPEAGFAAIRQAKNWSQVSMISDNFSKLFKKDLYGWLKIKYDTTAQKDILAKLVNYAFNLQKS